MVIFLKLFSLLILSSSSVVHAENQYKSWGDLSYGEIRSLVLYPNKSATISTRHQIHSSSYGKKLRCWVSIDNTNVENKNLILWIAIDNGSYRREVNLKNTSSGTKEGYYIRTEKYISSSDKEVICGISMKGTGVLKTKDHGMINDS